MGYRWAEMVTPFHSGDSPASPAGHLWPFHLFKSHAEQSELLSVTFKAFHNLALAHCSPPGRPSTPCLTNAQAFSHGAPPHMLVPLSGAPSPAPFSAGTSLLQQASPDGSADTPVLSSLLPTHFAHPSIIRTTKAAARPYSAFGQSRKRHLYLKMPYFICWKTLGTGVPTRDVYNVQGVSPGGAHTTPELPLWEHFHVPGTVLGTLCQILFAKPRRKTIVSRVRETKAKIKVM